MSFLDKWHDEAVHIYYIIYNNFDIKILMLFFYFLFSCLSSGYTLQETSVFFFTIEIITAKRENHSDLLFTIFVTGRPNKNFPRKDVKCV